MINNSNSSDTGQSNTQGTSPLNSKSKSNPIGKTKLKQYGKKSLAPMVDLLHRYKDQINPYMQALDKGLQAACDSFSSSQEQVQAQAQAQSSSFQGARGSKASGSNSDAERVVEGWFREAHDWFNGAREKMSTENPRDLLDYLEEQARDKPGLMFATSYVAGLVFGRLGRHIGRIKAKNASVSMPSMQGSTLQH